MKHFFLFSFLLYSCIPQVKNKQYDVIVYGATSSGIIAAVTASKYGKSVLIIESSNHLGGLTTGGLGQTDIGNKYAITGLSRHFYRKIGQHYGKLEQWTFEPSVAKNVFQTFLNETDVEVLYSRRINSVKIENGYIKAVNVLDEKENSKQIKGKVFIDCSYEGDLMAKAGVSYTYGREGNAQYNETWNGVHLLDKHQFPDGIDPYVIPKDTSSGYIYGVSNEKLLPEGSPDKKIQAYNFRLCLTDSARNQIPITRPEGYDSTQFELALRYIAIKMPEDLNWALMHIQEMPNRKTDINNSGPISTDFIGENYDYVEGDYKKRKEIFDKHMHYTKSFLYFLGNDLRVPEHLRKQMKKYGYPKDEFRDHNNFTPQLYVREARRMQSDYVMTDHNCLGTEVVQDGIGLAAYAMDSHNTQRLVTMGMVKNEGDVQIGWGTIMPYPIAYRSIVPKRSEIQNLIVPVCLSASHIAYGSIRMEPVFMVLGQAAGLAASMAIDKNTAVQEVSVPDMQKELRDRPLADNTLPEVVLSDENTVTFGKWQDKKSEGNSYGKTYKFTEDSTASIVYQTDKTIKNQYSIYAYMPQLNHDLSFEINGQRKKAFFKYIQGDWLYLGKTIPNEKLIIKINNQQTLLADDLILIPI